MKEVFSAFGSEVFRPVMTLLIPGGIALSTWIVGLMQRNSRLYELANANHVETGIVLLFASIAAGQVLEDFGARIEADVFDERLKKRPGFENHINEWFRYLRHAFKVEPVGHRYLRTLVLRMKFELGVSLAFVPCGIGLFYTVVSRPWASLWLGVCVSIALYLFFEAKSGHEALSELRRELLKGITVVGGELAPIQARGAGTST